MGKAMHMWGAGILEIPVLSSQFGVNLKQLKTTKS